MRRESKEHKPSNCKVERKTKRDTRKCKRDMEKEVKKGKWIQISEG